MRDDICTYICTYWNMSHSGMLIMHKNVAGFLPANLYWSRGLNIVGFTTVRLRSVDEYGASWACRAPAATRGVEQ